MKHPKAHFLSLGVKDVGFPHTLTHTLLQVEDEQGERERRTRKSTREVEMLKVLELQLPFPLYTLGQSEIFTRYGLYSLMQPLLLLATATLLPLAAATMLQQPIAA